jgi:hypothetical protein
VEAMFDSMYAELPLDLLAQRAEAQSWEKPRG